MEYWGIPRRQLSTRALPLLDTRKHPAFSPTLRTDAPWQAIACVKHLADSRGSHGWASRQRGTGQPSCRRHHQSSPKQSTGFLHRRKLGPGSISFPI